MKIRACELNHPDTPMQPSVSPCRAIAFSLVFCTLAFANRSSGQAPTGADAGTIDPVILSQIRLNGFWKQQIKLQTEQWLPHCVAQMEKGGRGQELLNLIATGKVLRGEANDWKFTGAIWSDAYVYNVMESICMHALHADAHYRDVQERLLYNAVLGSVELTGTNFYYQNPLESDKARYPWHSCPCCVGNIPRTLFGLKDAMYSTDNRGKVALQRGPLVYNVEDADHPLPVKSLVLEPAAVLTAKWNDSLLGGVMAIEGPGVAAVPNHVRLNRGGRSQVWLTENPAKVAESVIYDVVVYGNTSAGVMAAVQARRMGKSVILTGPEKHLGGLSSGGLGYTDTGNKAVIGGLARDFYHRVWSHYEKPESWKWQQRSEYGGKGQGTPAVDGQNRTMWIFEPHVAEDVFEGYLREFSIPVDRDQWLDRENGVAMRDGRIARIRMLGGKSYQGKMFIDATYEGDLMAAAKVPYIVGRESNSKYGETLNGNQPAKATSHQFTQPVSAYKVPGDPQSGLLPRIENAGEGIIGEGDHRVQAYCFRTCLTRHPDNRVPFTMPDGYDPLQYELLARYLQAGHKDVFRKFDPIPNLKTDNNNHGAFSSDNIGMNHDYPEASYERRRQIVAEHRLYQQGLYWFLANDPRVPEPIRTEMSRWGLAQDEFSDNGNWPRQIYIRVARRMVSDFVITEQHLTRRRPTPDPVGMGSYNMDSHNVRRYVDSNGNARNEGDLQINPGGPYPISYGSMIPPRGSVKNLLVPVCVSSSHISYGSIRMEPVFMILGQSAATAAVLAAERGIAVQEVPYADLCDRLLADGQVLKYEKSRPDSAKP